MAHFQDDSYDPITEHDMHPHILKLHEIWKHPSFVQYCPEIPMHLKKIIFLGMLEDCCNDIYIRWTPGGTYCHLADFHKYLTGRTIVTMYPDIVNFWSWDQYIEKVDGWFFGNFTRPIPCVERTNVGANNQSPPSIEVIDKLESIAVAQSLRPDASTSDIEDAIFDMASSITLPSLETMSTGSQDVAVYGRQTRAQPKMFATTENKSSFGPDRPWKPSRRVLQNHPQ
ncbi:hypothetical protein BT69DRAFT_1302326 [Atractiella rhizophila]|nr:hypothetical protein BT69DRAFT_1302326 [Atractiella rhizophila]